MYAYNKNFYSIFYAKDYTSVISSGVGIYIIVTTSLKQVNE